jgi:hypothetical protein
MTTSRELKQQAMHFSGPQRVPLINSGLQGSHALTELFLYFSSTASNRFAHHHSGQGSHQ